MSRTLAAADAGVREIGRTPVLLGLVVFLPAYLVGVFTYVAPTSEVAFEVVGDEAVRVSLARAFPAFTTPMVAALLSGIVGLFVMESTANADSRLVIAGYRPHQVVLGRLVVLTGVSGVVTLVAVGVMRAAFAPEHLGWFAVAVFLTAVIYGMVGVLAGVVLDRLPGVYLVLFGSTIDLFLFQNPMATDTLDAARFAPGHYPLKLAMDAGFGRHVELEPLAWSVGVLAVLGTLAVVGFYRAVRA